MWVDICVQNPLSSQQKFNGHPLKLLEFTE